MSDGPRRVQVGDVVGFRYLIKDENDVVLAASTELVHCVQGERVQGERSLPQGVEDAMKGRVCGETFTTTVSVRETMRRLLLPEDRFPNAFALEPGTRIDLLTPDGEGFAVWVEGNESKTLALGLDEPIVGKSIRFQVSIISIRVASLGEAERAPGATHVDSELEAELMDLRARLDIKFSNESAPGGLFEALVDDDFTTARRVGALRCEHSTLLSRLDGIIAHVREEGHAYDYRPDLVRLLRSVARHDHASTDMLSESANRDTGGEG